MKLKKLKLQNFRCYKELTTVDFNDLTTFVGRNDIGKSTILEALEIFFNNKLVVLEREDLSFNTNSNEISLSCIFSELPEQLVIDTAAPTSLAQEYMLNANGDLEIKKVFPCTSAKPKEKVHIVANYPSVEHGNNLHQLKIQELRLVADELGIDRETYNRGVNKDIRRAIWAHIGDLNLTEQEILIDKEDTKRVWEVLKSWMPMYALFKSDRQSKDDDQEVADPMKIAVQQAIKELTVELEEIKTEVRNRTIETANRTLEKLNEMAPDIAEELTPEFKTEPKFDSLFKLTINSDNNIPINKRGSGIRRLVLLNFFRSEAERRRTEANVADVIYAFEEPETSQHPDFQELLVKSFQELSEADKTQIILTTHTPALAGMIKPDNLKLIKLDNGSPKVFDQTNSIDILKEIADSLGILPDPISERVKLIICVEGKNDVNFFKNISNIYHQNDPQYINLQNDTCVVIIPMGGSSLKDWINKNYLERFNLPEYHIYDRDDPTNPPYQAAINEVNARGNDSKGVLTNKRESENYIHPDAINAHFGIHIANIANFDDVPNIIRNAVIANGGNISENKVKAILNDQVATSLTFDQLNQMDTDNEIQTWLTEIRDRT